MVQRNAIAAQCDANANLHWSDPRALQQQLQAQHKSYQQLSKAHWADDEGGDGASVLVTPEDLADIV